MTDPHLTRLALLDQAARLLDEVRLCHHDRPIRQSFAHHRELLARARSHIEAAQALAMGRRAGR